MTHPELVVVDASATVPVLVPEVWSESAHRLFAAEARDVRLVAPAFWRLECGNAIRKKVARRTLHPVDGLAALDRIERLALTTVDVSELLAMMAAPAFMCRSAARASQKYE